MKYLKNRIDIDSGSKIRVYFKLNSNLYLASIIRNLILTIEIIFDIL